ncbi:hypothetical protein BDZ45DRAFT_734025 [Acephala macrosclerotiorum]|nr:hypothetical protein BDZ45DRAFT_734025 [Acephala macrosclerotiorum]
MSYLSNLRSWKDVKLLIPELQKRGGTFRENIQLKPGQLILPDDHPGAKLRWNAKRPEASVIQTTSGATEVDQIVDRKEAAEVVPSTAYGLAMILSYFEISAHIAYVLLCFSPLCSAWYQFQLREPFSVLKIALDQSYAGEEAMIIL